MIEINNVSKIYGKKWLLVNVMLIVESGEVIGFLGLNGVGKLMFLFILFIIMVFLSGNVMIGGLLFKKN